MGKKTSSTKRFLSLLEVGDELGCSQSQAYALVRTGALPALKLGGRGQWRVERQHLELFIVESYAATREFVSTHPYGQLDEDEIVGTVQQ